VGTFLTVSLLFSSAVQASNQSDRFDLAVNVQGKGKVRLVKPAGRGWDNKPKVEECKDFCSAKFSAGAEVTLRAEADNGWQFGGWEGDCASKPAECTVTMKASKSITARFEELPSGSPPSPGAPLPAQAFQLVVTVQGKGKVRLVKPAGRGWDNKPKGQDCKDSCSANFSAGAEVTLRAEADNGWQFGGWEGDCASKPAECTVTMNASKSIAARFEKLPSGSPPSPGAPPPARETVKSSAGKVPLWVTLLIGVAFVLGAGVAYSIRVAVRWVNTVNETTRKVTILLNYYFTDLAEKISKARMASDSLGRDFARIQAELEYTRSALQETLNEIAILKRLSHSSPNPGNPTAPSDPEPPGNRPRVRRMKEILNVVNTLLRSEDYEALSGKVTEWGGLKVSATRTGGKCVLTSDQDGHLIVLETDLNWLVMPHPNLFASSEILGDPSVSHIYSFPDPRAVEGRTGWFISKPALAVQIDPQTWEVTAYGRLALAETKKTPSGNRSKRRKEEGSSRT